MAFEDTILLKLKRKYSEQEEMAFLVQKMKEIELDNGMLKSEVAELTDKLKAANSQLKQNQDLIHTLKKKNMEMNQKHSQTCQETLAQEKIVELKQEVYKYQQQKRKEQERYISLKIRYDKLLKSLDSE